MMHDPLHPPGEPELLRNAARCGAKTGRENRAGRLQCATKARAVCSTCSTRFSREFRRDRQRTQERRGEAERPEPGQRRIVRRRHLINAADLLTVFPNLPVAQMLEGGGPIKTGSGGASGPCLSFPHYAAPPASRPKGLGPSLDIVACDTP
jgi:hypothetical protein